MDGSLVLGQNRYHNGANEIDQVNDHTNAGDGIGGFIGTHWADPAYDAAGNMTTRCGVSINEADKNGVTPLHRAVRFRSLAAVQELIAHGADVNVVDKKTKSTPLHRAVTNTGAPATAGKANCAIEIAKLLLSNGADPQIKNKNGKTPLDYVKNTELKNVFCTAGQLER